MKAAVVLLCLAVIVNTAICQVTPRWPIPGYLRRPLPPCTLETPIGQLEYCVDVDGIGFEILLRLNNENFPGAEDLPPCTYETLIVDLDKCFDVNGIGWEMLDKAGIIPQEP
ncbi:uncharacterized protein LOC126565676 [Anopheles maculipalpis]|uniref:uncharacterized protein LOC126565676 n=1 Tax=Anopheles maculipalpis TaxID=1496333 RepID=UPI002159A2AD|nr:uncharacterized protein LOC126565676 [Anopheles maculipalpis]